MIRLRTATTSLLRLHTPPRFIRLSSTKPPPWAEQPSPPRLPKEEQDLFEELQRRSTGAFQTSGNATMEAELNPVVNAEEQEELLEHPHLQKGERPLFEGEVNPATGEVGGPKTDPLKYGDYAFNGRVTDF